MTKRPKRKNVRVAAKTRAKRDELGQRFDAACGLWKLGEYEPAADAFCSVLDADPADPYYCRYWLASCFFQLDSTDELDMLLERHDDGSGTWRFAQALQAFRQSGDTEDAQRILTEAHRLEPIFHRFLLQDALVDASREVRFDAGRVERSRGFARLFLPAWRAVPGAATWARRVLKVAPAGADPEELSRRFPLEELQTLPLRRETWQVGLLPFRDEPGSDAEPMWLFGVVNLDGQEMRAVTVIDRPLTDAVVWNELIPSFLGPMDGDAARPSTLVVSRREWHNAWRPLLKEIGVRCEFEVDPQPVGQLLEAMSHVMENQQPQRADDVDIREFPQSYAVWQADFIRSPAWVMNEREGAYPPWSVIVLEKSRSRALMTASTPGDPTPEMLLDFLVRTMVRPGGGASERPRRIEVSDSDCYDHLRPRLEAAGITCRLVDELGEFNDFCLALARGFDGPEKCALADGAGVTRAHMESYYEAAAYYFREAPWRRVPGEVPIEIRCDDPDMGTRYGIVMGRTGVQLGLGIYDDWRTVQAALDGRITPDKNRALAVCYDEAQIMAAVDLQLIERLGWPIATPEAWPAVMRLEPRRTPRSPTADELVFLDACLRAIPDFLKTKATSRVQVETGTRLVALQLDWKG